MQLNENSLIFLRGEIEKKMSKKRLLHTFAVEKEISTLGKLYGFDKNGITKLRVSALLHDITKEINIDGQISYCKQYGIKITKDDLKSPKLFHSLTGAHLARQLYPDIVDKTIFNAIRFHTSGKPNMSMFEKLLYLADYIEETRVFADCVTLRNFFYSSKEFTLEHLDKTLLLSYDLTIKNLLDEVRPIHPKTIAARNSLIKN